MTERVRVYVTSLDQWRHVLFTWFDEGYSWIKSKKDKNLHEEYFNGPRGKVLNLEGKCISWSDLDVAGPSAISYTEFMERYGGNDEVETYYVTREQLDLIEELKSDDIPFYNLVYSTTDEMRDLAQKIPNELDSKILRYVGGDKTIEFKVKENLYRLWRIDDNGDEVYMIFLYGTPDWTMNKDVAFTAPKEEIEKWKTPAWMVEPVKEEK